MESRTRWRKGEPGTREGVAAVLDALRDACGAEAVGLFDDDRAPPGPTPEAGQLNLWEAFGGLPCVNLDDWEGWYRALKADKRADAPCACGGGHRVHGFALHDRWMLLLVTPAVLAPGAAAGILSGVKALSDRLPPAKKPLAMAGGPDVEPVIPGTSPLWLVRKARR